MWYLYRGTRRHDVCATSILQYDTHSQENIPSQERSSTELSRLIFSTKRGRSANNQHNNRQENRQENRRRPECYSGKAMSTRGACKDVEGTNPPIYLEVLVWP